MRTKVRQLSAIAIVIVLLTLSACAANRPPNLSAPATVAYQNTRVIKGLDVIRDIAIDANKQTPPLVTTQTTRQIVSFHRIALMTIHGGPGWKPQVQAGLNAALAGANPSELQFLQPYLKLAAALLDEVK